MKRESAVVAYLCSLYRVQLVHSFSQQAPAASSSVELDSKQERLTFVADCSSTVSEIVPQRHRGMILDYIQQKEFSTLLFDGGGSRSVEVVPISEEMLNMWNQQCERWQHCLHLETDLDSMLATVTSVNFPGLEIKSESYFGVKIQKPETGLPYYDVVVFAEKRSASGLKPVKWIYDSLTGKKSGNLQLSSNQIETRVSALDIDGDIGMQIDTKFQINVEFPKALKRILPMSKEKVEKSGSQSCLKVIQKEINTTAESIGKALAAKVSALDAVE